MAMSAVKWRRKKEKISTKGNNLKSNEVFTDRFKVSTKPDIVQGPVAQSPISLIRD